MKIKDFKAIVSDHGSKGLEIGLQRKEVNNGKFEVRLLIGNEALPVVKVKDDYSLNVEYQKFLAHFVKSYFGARTNKDICKALLEGARAEAKTCRKDGRYYLIRAKGQSMYFVQAKTQAKAWKKAADKLLARMAKDPKVFLKGQKL